MKHIPNQSKVKTIHSIFNIIFNWQKVYVIGNINWLDGDTIRTIENYKNGAYQGKETNQD